MRFNFLLVILIIVALIASGFFLINYFKKSNMSDEFEEQTAASNKEIQELEVANELLTREIDDIKFDETIIQNTITAEDSNIVSKTNSNEIIQTIMELGLKNGTNIIPLSNSDWSKEKIQEGDYQVLKLTLTIEGNEQSIINFIKGLQDLYPTLVIENLQILTIDINTSDSINPNQTVNNDRFTSNLSIVIYSR